MKDLTVIEHLTELRRRVIYVCIMFVFSLLGGFLVADPIYHFLKQQVNVVAGLNLHAFSFWDGIGIYMKISFLASFIITLPFALLQLWKFVRPGLQYQERKAALRYIPYLCVMFVIGLLFAYYIVFPMALQFTTSITDRMGLQPTYGLQQYFSFMFNILFPIALVFELPLLLMFLTVVGVVTPSILQTKRKIAYFILLFISIVITPPDLISAFLVYIPLLLLYELSIFLSSTRYNKQQ